MNRSTAALISGLLFALGLGISGMTLPAKVIGFLDLFGDWDPSLAFVMAGAIGVNVLATRLLRRPSDRRLTTPQRPTGVDSALIGGAILFGLGWGLVGYCPGPALVGLISFELPVLVFCTAMAAGMLVFHRWRAR